jgi:trimeric autotransporter adhesin
MYHFIFHKHHRHNQKPSLLVLSITLILFILAGPTLAQVEPQIITFAGDGTYGYSGDGGLATVAQLNQPWGLAADQAGNVYLADSQNHSVRKIDPQGIITTVVGNGTRGYSGDGGPATVAKLSQPKGVALDSVGNLYIADSDNHVLRKVSSQGKIVTIAGNNTPGYRGDGGPATLAQLHLPVSVTIDQADNLYIADQHNHVIRKIDKQGVITTVAGNNIPGYRGDGGFATVAQLHSPADVAVDKSGNLYLADSENHVIRKVDVTGKIATVAGDGTSGYRGDGQLASQAQLNVPTSVALDSKGNLYVSDSQNYRLRKIDTGGSIVTVAGNGVRGHGGEEKKAMMTRISEVNKVVVDKDGNVYLSETDLHRVLKISRVSK